MTDKDIHDAFARIQPDDAAQKRMLQHILQSANRMPVRKERRQYLLLAATLAIIVSVTAYISIPYFGGLWRIQNQETGETTTVSWQGILESPEYRACTEWWEFWSEYTEDRNFSGSDSAGIPNDYDAYSCYDNTMREKADELCRRYQLELLGPEVNHNDPYNLFVSAGVGNLFDTGRGAQGENQYGWGYRYPCGTFFFEGTLLWSDGSETDYQFVRSRKGYFYTAVTADMLENCEQRWEYTTENGVQLLLGLSPSSGLLLADTETSFVTVNVLGDLSRTFDMGPEELEAMAEMFNFSAVP